MHSKFIRGLVAMSFVGLTACGGNNEGASPTNAASGTFLSTIESAGSAISSVSSRVIQGGTAATLATVTPVTGRGATVAEEAYARKAASHFLHMASFGPNEKDVEYVAYFGAATYLNAGFGQPQTSHLEYMQQYAASLPAGKTPNSEDFQSAFWKIAVTTKDQLRQRVAFALSEIFVISTADDSFYFHPYGVASYYDTLGKHAFGNFRDLLQGIALHPMMGIYLTHLGNMKEDGVRMPDENFAREIMQLMTIGPYMLNQDGTVKLVDGKPVETYTHDDILGLAKVFTGWGWAGPDQDLNRMRGWRQDYPAQEWLPMQNYAAYHSSASKSFLGKTIPAGGSGASDVKVALDTLFNHPNVGPFISRLLIQRLVTSNPSPAYVGRVAAAFNSNGAGVRGDMKAVIRAILCDSEALDMTQSKRIREPVLRLANFLRAFNATSVSGWYAFWPQDDPASQLGQSALRSPSVFNFYRPSYTPPNSTLSSAGMVAPEMQITTEPSVTGYLNYMQLTVRLGAGKNFDVQPDYTKEIALAAQPQALLDRLNLLLMHGSMSSTLNNLIISRLNTIAIPAATSTNAADVLLAKQRRTWLATYLIMASTEYIVQK
ncbi:MULTISPECIES: DUF1800 family protein [unclassified Duganella]|uniref:DUF1800 domain-containing protein n=1 Tax=unclassified Duganella TaxID=2636909 RepID=UPI00088BB903|nr:MULTISPECIES: DUF1800 domain-containing protein [unclassified Duganella]SDG57442.1 Uncharacterized conserved protein, DUF1800 family [Duganella sp. OV458]SDJ80397.1 Uncharacterized conserved protein, DUF1800 family [Duganella sp. OV510]